MSTDAKGSTPSRPWSRVTCEVSPASFRSRQMERLLSAAEKAGAKVVLVGDPEQLQAIEAGAAFRSIAERHSHVEITQVRRQHEDWQRDATRHLATGRTGEALASYEARGMVHAAETRDQAREDLVERWDRERIAELGKSRIILTHTNDEVRDLNLTARDRLRQAGALGEDVIRQRAILRASVSADDLRASSASAPLLRCQRSG